MNLAASNRDMFVIHSDITNFSVVSKVTFDNSRFCDKKKIINENIIPSGYQIRICWKKLRIGNTVNEQMNFNAANYFHSILEECH